jgi:hypothetical protein
MDAIQRIDSVVRSLERQLDKENYDARLDDFIANTLYQIWDFRNVLENEKIQREYDEAQDAALLYARN